MDERTLDDVPTPVDTASPPLLDTRAVRVLRATSVYGRTFCRGGAYAVAPELSRADVDDALDALVSAGVIEARDDARFDGEDGFAFADTQRLEALETSISTDERAVASGRAARWLQSMGELDVTVIATLLLKSDAPHDAAPWCAEVATNAHHDGAYDAALSWSEYAIMLGVDATTEASLRMMQTGVHDARGAIELAERCAAKAWRVAPPATIEWFRAASSLAVLSMRRLRPERFRELGPAIEEALRNPNVGAAAAGLANAVFPMVQAGQYALADAVLERLGEILDAGEYAEPTFPAKVYAARALRALFGDDAWTYLQESTRAARSYELLGDARFALLYWNNVGFAHIALGDGDAAAETLNAVIQRASALDLQRVVAAARHNLGMALTLTGHLAEACALERHVIASAESLGDGHLAATAWIYLARALLARGDLRGAIDAVDRGRVALPTQPGAQVFGLAIRASALVALQRHDEALRDATEAMRVLSTVGSVEEGEALARLAHVEALRAVGELDEAARALTEARERLMLRAEQIPDVDARARFLSHVPEHARTLSLS